MKVKPWAVVAGLVLMIALFAIPQAGTKRPLVTINNVTYRVEIADQPDEREKGLQGRTELAADAGMLFVFNLPGRRGFWNKDTFIPLDLVFINDNKIVDLTSFPAYTSDAEPIIYRPSQQANYVLEINQGQAAEHNFKIGDAVLIQQ